MKTKNIITVFTALLMFFTSCTLKEEPHDQILPEDAYNTPEELFQNTIATLYSYIGGNSDGQGLQGTERGVYDLITFSSDEALIPTRGGDWYDGGIWQDMYRHSWGAGHELIKNSWLYLYKVITLCNYSLEIIDEFSDLLDPTTAIQYTSEVRALRAIYYWYLLDLFGRVPVITSFDISLADVQQSERSEVFKFVLEELLESYKNLPAVNCVRHNDYYARITQPVAIFVLAKLMLNSEIYNDDNWTDDNYTTGNELKFTIDGIEMNSWEATLYFCEMMEIFDYMLEPEYRTNFTVRNEVSRENIWIIAMDKDLYPNEQHNMYRSYHYRHAAAYGFSGENGTCATKKLLETYDYGTESQDTRLYENLWVDEVYDLNNEPVTDRSGNILVYYPLEIKLDLSGSPYVETAGARIKKYEIDKNAKSDGKLMDNDIVLFRYADVLLMRAEALMRLGWIEEGQNFFNLVRHRANMPDRTLNEKNLLDERMMELCWEGWRRQDLIRFRQYRSLYEGSDAVDESDGHTTVFPIPNDIIILNNKLKQNLGY